MRLEKSADILLVDPKKAPPPNRFVLTLENVYAHGCNVVYSYSFKFIDRCLRAGKLLDVEEFCAGPAPGSLRPVGSTTEPPRAHRRAFTAKDDQILYDWVKSAEEKGEQIWGNKIYQQLQERVFLSFLEIVPFLKANTDISILNIPINHGGIAI